MQLNKLLNFILITLFFGCSFSCKKKGVNSEGKIDGERTPTITSEFLEISNFREEGVDYKFKTPLMERYELIDSPYTIFKKGIYIETFNDSTGNLETTLEGDYARYDEKTKIWEAKGNVVASSTDGKTLYTEQIFWDEKNKKVYSNVRTKIVQGNEVNIGVGFEADDKLKNGIFRRPIGRFAVDTTKNNTSDTTRTENK